LSGCASMRAMKSGQTFWSSGASSDAL